MKYINIKISEEEFAQLDAVKGDRTWREYIMKDVMNQSRRQQLQNMINGEGQKISA